MLKLVLPKGSLEKATLELFAQADLTVNRSSSVDYSATIDDPRIGVLPSLKAPTVSQLYGAGGFAVEAVVSKAQMNILIPALSDAGGPGDRASRAAASKGRLVDEHERAGEEHAEQARRDKSTTKVPSPVVPIPEAPVPPRRIPPTPDI